MSALTNHDHSNAGVDMISSGHRSQEKHEEAEPLYRRVLGPEYPLCWLLGTSVRKTRRFLGTDVPSSQHRGKACSYLGSDTKEEMRRSRGRIRYRGMRLAGERAERNEPEPTGFQSSVTNFFPVLAPWHIRS